MRSFPVLLMIVGCLVCYESRCEPDSDESGTNASFVRCHETCMKDQGGDIPCAAICMAEENEKIDADLNTTYKQLRSRLKGTPLEKLLVEAERIWIRDRNKRCKEISEADYDTVEEKNDAHAAIAAELAGCMQEEAQARLGFLKDALSRLDRDGIEKFHLQ